MKRSLDEIRHAAAFAADIVTAEREVRFILRSQKWKLYG